MAAVKNVIKFVSNSIGELLVVGGALGTAYVLGFIKGSEVKPKIKGVVDEVDKKIKETVEKPKETTEEPAEENSEPESENEEVGPSIEVTHNNQTED